MARRPPEPAQKEQNEYIPAFISKKPFYLESADSETDYLEHQRLQTSAADQSKWYERGKRLGPAATRYRKGACENCGAMTHKTKECLNRPRAKGARWSGKDIQADEAIQDVQLGWDAKRDRWNGYDATEYQNVVEEFEELENIQRMAREGKDQEQNGSPEVAGTGAAVASEEAKYTEESDMGRKQSTATRNLRLREDTAKYLLNLDLDSAKYDPKTRSMVDMGAQVDQAAALVAEDNFMRASGDAAEFEKAQKYAWETQERGDKTKIHLQANPTSGEYLRRKEKVESDKKKRDQRKVLLEKYGGEQHLQPSETRNMVVVESERFVEYDETGAVKVLEKDAARSKYPEDVFFNNHTSVWGSWWSNFQWGYECCHSTVKNSYCIGHEGRRALEETKSPLTREDLDEDHPSQNFTEGAEPLKSESVERPTATEKLVNSSTTRKRALNEMKDGVTEEELEAYKRSRFVAEDPMAKFLGKDELVR